MVKEKRLPGQKNRRFFLLRISYAMDSDGKRNTGKKKTRKENSDYEFGQMFLQK